MERLLDTGTPAGREADRRLRTAPIIWLITVRDDGQPQTSPVWFLWDARTILVFSRPESGKVPNIRGNPRVAMNLDGDGLGGAVVTLEGIAEIQEGQADARHTPEYIRKYHELIVEMGSDDERFAQGYSTAIRIRPTRARLY
jgi:PPOX class probable F420-dependent enzyme